VHTRDPLPALLSQTLVAFTIELDNEFEQQIVAAGARPHFLVSLVMWSNFMRFVPDDGLSVRELSARACVAKGAPHPSLPGMERWGYVSVERDPAETRPKPPRADWIVRATRHGQKAQEVWRPLPNVVEERWRARRGAKAIEELRAALGSIAEQVDVELPAYLPVLGHGLVPAHFDDARPAPERDLPTDLPALLSQVLLAFALEFERESELSLAICANALRVLDAGDGVRVRVRVRDLPRRTGVSKEAISVMTGFLDRRGYVVVEPDPALARTKLVRLTQKGRAAAVSSRELLGAVEARWPARYGAARVGRLRASLEALAGDGSSLFEGLAPSPEGWRASVPAPDVLPHYPTVLHRGGWPDGS
jgi:DNA-binding MarR family transcriptional regulator